ncbi:MAG: LptF/LptG family permease [Prevotellaceae bacterium]|jgi:lipopolysaccharide export system permease protein|nr:LptF/LptG family permease [Prevotellaceae bacterium]
MKILDWYIIKKYVSAYVFIILAMTVIIVVFDTSERVDDFVEKNAPLSEIIFDYYGHFVPYLITMFSGLFAFIAVIFFTSKMASHTEIVAMLSNGVSFGRIMRPYLMVAVVIALFNGYLANFVIPAAAQKGYEFDAKYLKPAFYNNNRNIHRQTQRGRYAYIESFQVHSQTASKFSLENISDGQLHSKLTSSYAQWDTAKNVWHVHDYVLRTITDSGEVIRQGKDLDTLINLTGTDLSVRLNTIVVTMGYREINDYIDMLLLQGANANVALIEKHKRFAYPVASIILTIIGVCLSSRKVRGGMGLHIGIGVGLSFAYILLQRFSEIIFVQTNTLSPAMALWIPNVLFLLIGLWLYHKTPK